MSDREHIAPDSAKTPLWFDELRPGGKGSGFLERNQRHSLLFVKRKTNRLLITFDNLSNVNQTDTDRDAWAFKFAKDLAVSHLGVFAHRGHWYRDKALIERFERLVEDGFFDGYDRVMFAGVSMGAFAAIAFGSLIPGAHVVAINPQSTLDEQIVPWETRYKGGRKQDWSLPLSDAAQLTGNLGRVNIFYDPYHALDKRHIARFSGDNIRIYNCRHSGHKTAVFLRKIGALKPVMENCLFGELDTLDFYQRYRARRDLPWYRGAVTAYFDEKGRADMSARFTQAFRSRARKNQGASPTSEASPRDRPTPLPPLKVVSSPSNMGPRQNKRFGIVTTMKNEGPFMLEWVAYHQRLGFTDFLIFTNDCDDGTDLIAQRLEALGVAKHLDNKFKKGGSPQRVALRRTLKEDFYADCDWVICTDCDEFLNIRVGDGRLPDLVKAVGPADAISFCWKLFGCGENIAYDEGLITEKFTWSAEEGFRGSQRALGLKTMFRPHRGANRFGVHRPKFDQGRPQDFIWKDAGGQLMPEQYYQTGWSAWKGFRHDFARLHHYSVRSIDSFLVKRDRGRTNHVDQDQGIAYWADMNINMIEDTSLSSATGQTRAAFDSLLQDAELARLHADACDWHRNKIEELKDESTWRLFRRTLQRINRPGEVPVSAADLPGFLVDE